MATAAEIKRRKEYSETDLWHWNDPAPSKPQPIQPIVNGRFQPNNIVKFLLSEFHKQPVREGRHWNDRSMNVLAGMGFSPEDQAQFAQLIGYSVGGIQELHYVHENEEIFQRIVSAVDAAEAAWKK